MKLLCTMALLAASIFINDLCRCPCQDQRRPEQDRRAFVCNGDGTCECECEIVKV